MEDDKLIGIPRKRLAELVEQVMDLTARRIDDAQDIDELNEVRGELNAAADLSAKIICLIEYGDEDDSAAAASMMNQLNARTEALKSSCDEIKAMMLMQRPEKKKTEGWTMVEECPPRIRTSVLVYHKYGAIRIAQLTLNRSREITWYDGLRYWKTNLDDWWHPLPEIPEEGGNE